MKVVYCDAKTKDMVETVVSARSITSFLRKNISHITCNSTSDELLRIKLNNLILKRRMR